VEAAEVIRIIEAFTGRRIAAAVEPDPTEAGEVAALKARLTASEGEVRRLLGLLHDRAGAQLDADEEIVRLRAANARLADLLEAYEPAARYGPTALAPATPTAAVA
jgi:hypothetical protein